MSINFRSFLYMIAAHAILLGLLVAAGFSYISIDNIKTNILENESNISEQVQEERALKIQNKIRWNYAIAVGLSFLMNFFWSLTGWVAEIDTYEKAKRYRKQWGLFLFIGLIMSVLIFFGLFYNHWGYVTFDAGMYLLIGSSILFVSAFYIGSLFSPKPILPAVPLATRII